MRSFITLGVVSLVGVAGMFACGDDTSDGPSTTGGSGGATAGTGGASGGSGGATAGTGGATAGTGGATGGTGGATVVPPGPLATCSGCVELIVPATGPNDNGGTTNLADQAIFQFNLATPVDYSNAVVTWRVAAVAPNAAHFVQAFVQNGAPSYAGAYFTFALDPVAFPANTFKDVTIDIAALAAAPGDAGVVDSGAPAPADVDAGDAGAAPAGPTPFIAAGFDKSLISAYGLTVGVGATATGSAVVRVAVDGVTVTNAAGQDHTFNTAVEGFALNTYQAPPGTPAVFLHP